MNRIIWSRIDEQTFNDLVEALLVKDNTGNGVTAMAIDGRGGDGGIDIDVRANATNQIVRIYQLKFFPEGFSGGFATARRKQIRKSLDAALETETPPMWVLVVPRKVTIQERKAVLGMRKGRKVVIRFVGPPELDALLAKYPEIERRFTQDREVEILREVGRESQALARPDDLAAEVRRLSDRLDGRSVYWGAAFGLSPNGTYSEQIYAKRPDAAEREPLSIDFTLQFDPQTAALRDDYASAMSYGLTKPIVLPASVVKEFRKAGPEWFASEHDGGQLEFYPLPDATTPRRLRIAALDAGKKEIRGLTGSTEATASGSEGWSLEASFPGGLTISLRFPYEAEEPGNMAWTFKTAGQTPAAVSRAIRFADSVASAAYLSFSVDDRPPALLSLHGGARMQPPVGTREYFNDLAAVDAALELDLIMPERGISVDDRIAARVAAMIVGGDVAALPRVNGLNFTLSGERGEGIEQLLAEGGRIMGRRPEWAMEVQGMTIRLRDVVVFHPHVKVPGGSALLESLRAGTAEGLPVTLEGQEGVPFIAFTLERQASGDPLIVEPWNVPGAPEHPGFKDLRDRQLKETSESEKQ